MSQHSLRAADYLAHMIEAIDRIQTYTQNTSEEEFESNNLLQDAVLRNLGVLGEAAKNFLVEAPEEARRSSEVPFAKIYGMRNQIEHGYFTVDIGIVWNVVVSEMPKLRPQLEIILRSISAVENG
jgi:uncharacterized protein with HEPN domain